MAPAPSTSAEKKRRGGDTLGADRFPPFSLYSLAEGLLVGGKRKGIGSPGIGVDHGLSLSRLVVGASEREGGGEKKGEG